LAEKKINPLPSPLKKLAWKVHCPSGHGQSTFNTKYNLKKKPPLQPLTTPTPKKPRHPESMIGPSHWLDEIPLRKTVRHNFLPGLVPLAKEHPSYIDEKGRILGKTYGFEI